MEKSQLTIAQGILRLVDPHDCTDIKEARSVHEAFFDALVKRDHDLTYKPGLATSWKLEPDARTWTFSLREGVTFHNGESCDAEAVKFSIERMAQPNRGGALGASAVYAKYLGGAEIQILDAHTIRLTTQSPMADLLDILADGYILPPKAANELGAEFKSQPIGTGPYRFVEWLPNNRIVGEANTSYFRDIPRIQRITWKLVPDPIARRDAVLNAEAEIATDLGPQAMQNSSKQNDLHQVKVRGTTSIIYFLNCLDGVCQDKRVRQALNYAVDKNEIIESLLKGAGYPLSSFVGAGHLGYDSTLEPYPYDPVRAKSLLANAGYGQGLALNMIAPTSFPAEAEALSKRLVEQLARIGVQTELTLVPDRAEYANRVSGKNIQDLCCFDSSPLSTYRVLREKISSAYKGSWWQGYSNPRIDTLIEQGSQTVNTQERAALYTECLRIVHGDAPWLFLYDPQHTFGVNSGLSHWRPRSDGTILVQEI